MTAPSFADLDAATAATQAALDGGSRADVEAAAAAEAALYDQYPAEPEGHAGLEAHEAAIEEPPEAEAG